MKVWNWINHMMLKCLNNRGSVSIYLTLIFLSFIILAGVLVDAACINTGRVHIERAADIAVRSILSEYDRNLKNEYGLFATELTEEEMEEKISAYMNRMMRPSLGLEENQNNMDFYDFKLKGIQVNTDDLSLNNLKIFENQIVEYMRYRAVLGALGDFTKNVEQMEKAANGLILMEKAAVVYKALEDLDDVLNRIRKYSDGWYYDKGKNFRSYSKSVKSLSIVMGQDGKESYVKNLFGLLKDGYKVRLKNNLFSPKELENINQNYIDDFDEYVYNRCSLKGLRSAERTIFRRLSNLESTADESNEEQRLQYIQWLDDINEKKEDYFNDIESQDIQAYVDFYKNRQDACNEALEAINELILTGKHIQELVDEVNGYLDESDNKIVSELKETIKKDMATISTMVNFEYGTGLYDAQRKITQNKKALDRFLNAYIDESVIRSLEEKAYNHGRYIDDNFNIKVFLKELKNTIHSNNIYQREKENYDSEWRQLLRQYDSDFLVEPFSTGQFEWDVQNAESYFEIENLEEQYDHKEELYEPVAGINGRQLKNHFIYERLPTHIHGIESQPIMDTGIVDGLNIHQMSWNHIKNKLYLNEYVLSFFKHHTNENINAESFFEHEVEYILYGEYSEKKNFTRFQSDLFLLRVGMNMVHIYSDPVKRQQVLKAALPLTTISPFFAQLLITSAWAAAESKLDLDELLEGEEVAFMKTKEDWRLSLDAVFSSNKNVKNNQGKIHFDKKKNKDDKDEGKQLDINKLDYEDYLRLFLLFRKKEDTLYRTLDLIQLNMKGRHYKDFETRYYFGGCKVKAESSIKHIFLKFQWMPEYIQNETLGRKDIDVQVQHSY
ncbi:MAG: DUF5702 domain-containing protein [Clostridia bacterium]|nr:DUF5702 domain-containing protein [Clostridia bacterium]